MEIAVLILTSITAIGALLAAISAWRSAIATRRATQAQIFRDLFEEYSTEEMLSSLVQLRKWKASFDMSKTSIEDWAKHRDSWGTLESKVNKARRHVKYYFMKAVKFYQLGLLDQDAMPTVCNVNGINLLYDVVEPMERLSPRIIPSALNRNKLQMPCLCAPVSGIYIGLLDCPSNFIV